MLFDGLGLPKDTGATDKMDSARLAGLMVAINYKSSGINLDLYTKYGENGVLVATRHPEEVPSNNYKNFTRDQLIPLAAGLKIQGKSGTARKLYHAAIDRGYRGQNTEADVDGSVKKFPNGADIFTPSHMNHLRMCADEGSSLIGRLWLKLDILFNAKFYPMSEPNQLICMMLIAGPEYVKMWTKLNSKWKDAIREYWSGWRQEPELAEELIAHLNSINSLTIK